MKLTRIAVFAACFMSILVAAAAAQEADKPGSADHPALGRYQGSVITFFEKKAYEELSLPKKVFAKGDKENPASWLMDLSGEVTSIRYEGPADRSILEVMRNYESSLKADGFEIVVFCRGKEQCSPQSSAATLWDAGRGGIGMPSTWDTTVYLLASRKDAGSEITIGLLGVETRATSTRPLTPHVAATIVVNEAMDIDQITLVEASEMEQALARDGKIAIYGIYFDFDSATLQADSRPQIEQLGELMADNPALAVLIVGHTDGQGAFDYNLSLSQRRAQAVVDALVSGAGIAVDRLTPAGAGMVAPVATNRTEEGRAKNRRVEIVELVR